MADTHNTSHKVNYTAIFVILCVCTGLSVLADMYLKGIGWKVMVAAVMGIAVVKATFVLLYFMHIKFETAWKYILLTPTMVLAMALPLALSPDVGFHYYTVQVPQTLVPLPNIHGGAGGHGSGHDKGDAHGGKDHAESPAAKHEEKKH